MTRRSSEPRQASVGVSTVRTAAPPAAAGTRAPAPARRRRTPSRALLGLRREIPRPLFSLAGVVVPALLLAAWWYASANGLVRPLFLPSPTAVLVTGYEQLLSGTLLGDASVSIYRIVVGWLAATLLAVPTGVLMGNFRLIEGALEPLISTARYMPVVALIPLSILWAGIGDGQKILILFLGTFFQQVLMVMDDVKSVDMNLVRAGQTLGFSGAEILRRIVLPASLPRIWDTLRITIGWTWTYLVVAELVASNSGLGYAILRAQRYMHTDKIFAGILLIGLIGLLTDQAFRWLGRRAFHWQKR